MGPGVEPEKIAKWEIRHQQAATLDPRAEFAEVLRGLGAVVEGEHPIMNGERQRIRAENDKRGEQTIFYIGYLDGVPNGYAENNRTKEVDLPAPARKTIDLEGRLVKDGVRDSSQRPTGCSEGFGRGYPQVPEACRENPSDVAGADFAQAVEDD